MDESVITADECKKILKKISKTAKFFTHSVKSLSEEVEGYLSHHYSLTIRYIEDDIPKKTELFMKEQPKDNGFLTEMAKSLNAYQKENFVYSIYEDLEKMKNFEPFAAKCYYFRDDLLVLDNLKYEGYAVTDRNVLYNLDECKAALKTLAFYHSAFIGYEETKSGETGGLFRWNAEYPREFEDKFYDIEEDSTLGKFLGAAKKLMIDLLDHIQDDTIDKAAMKELVMKENENPNRMDFLKRFRQCPIHNDLWAKNIMFKRSENVITDGKLVDFQLLRYFLPSYDLALFFHYNTSFKFRQIHKEELVQFYYDCLDTQLELYGVTCSKIIPYQDILDGVTICEPTAIIQAFNDNVLLRLPETLLAEAMSNPALLEEVIVHRRSENIIKLLDENNEFKQYVLEEMLEFCDTLEQKQTYVKSNTLL